MNAGFTQIRKEMNTRFGEVNTDIRALSDALIRHIESHSHTPTGETIYGDNTPADTSGNGITTGAAPLPDNAAKPELQG